MYRRFPVFALVIASCGSGPIEGGAGGLGGAGGAGGVGGAGVVATSGLVAYSGSTRLGVVLDATENLLWVWDTDSDLLFWLNDRTGFVGGDILGSITPISSRYYLSNDCSGDIYYWLPGDVCSAPGERARGAVRRDDGDTEGWTQATVLYVATEPGLITADSMYTGSFCDDVGSWTPCAARFVQTNLIPTAFQLPIEVVQE